METRFFIDLHGQLLQRQTVPMSSRRNSGMLSQVQKGRENSDNNPCYLLQLRRFLHWSRGSVVYNTTMHHILVVIVVVVFLQLTHQFSREKFPTKPNCSSLEFFFSLLPTVWFLTFYSHIPTTQKLPHYSYTEAS
jgi:ABC-type maltose transport system permease subunit